ncbi:MAG TPA: hypothetical protein DDW50_18730 [Firmicutes bacterium]|jgi:iron only hydrogenase large subunit-like protein/uncharacterized Fe-S cluster-containing protein|nr:hypothetical protein [Bacillota bacterium]
MGLISTVQASCRDCYKCVRSCPVKAIRVINGHAEVVEERCIADGRCVRVCPQNAKKVESSIDGVEKLLHSGAKVAVSLAPSFTGAFRMEYPGQIVSALKKLGFDYVGETAEGAALVAEEHRRLVAAATIGKPFITSCCPAIVNLLEIYYHDVLPYLAPIVSPMTAHGKILKKRYGPDTKVVFAGPCIAKKGESRGKSGEAAIDAVLTFQELTMLLTQENIDLSQCENIKFDSPSVSHSRTFPLPGGLAKSAALSTDLLAKEIITIDGLDEVIDFLAKFHEVKNSLRLIELLACKGGCVTGPEMTHVATQFTRRYSVIQFAEEPSWAMEHLAVGDSLKNEGSQIRSCSEEHLEINLTNDYTPRSVYHAGVSEEQIREILARTGKLTSADELNCGACGYNSCRDKALAVAAGMAEVDMCIPYMRARAESKANIICQMTPNAIIVVRSNLEIVEINPAAENKFSCGRMRVVGQQLATIMDPKHFEEALRSKKLVTGEVTFPDYGMVAWQGIFYVEKNDVIIGIFVDITEEKKQRERFSRVTDETLAKAQEVINKQMKVAQEIAGLLGETTAETKVQLTKLMHLIKNEERKGDL